MSISSAFIHPSAIIEKGAVIGENAQIGPFCFIGAQVQLGANAHLSAHVVLEGNTVIGANAHIHSFAVLGGNPQSTGYKGEETRLEIGENCVVREGVTLNKGTVSGDGLTKIGNNCYFMANSHVGHDCFVGNNVILANSACLGGHVQCGDFVFVGGNAAVHQFTRIGESAMISGMAGVKDDIIPFGTALGSNGAELIGLNVIGLKRRGFTKTDLHTVRACYNILFKSEDIFENRLAQAKAQFSAHPVAAKIIDFCEKDKRPLMKARRHAAQTSAHDE